MKYFFAVILTSLILSCSGNESDCGEPSSAYWTTTVFGTPHNSTIQGENFRIRREFAAIKTSQTNIAPPNGFITLKIHIDKYGNFCTQENYQIDSNYQPTEFNKGELIKKLEEISRDLEGWHNSTKTKTYYLIRLTIKNGRIEEIF